MHIYKSTYLSICVYAYRPVWLLSLYASVQVTTPLSITYLCIYLPTHNLRIFFTAYFFWRGGGLKSSSHFSLSANFVRFQVLTAAKLKMTAFWDIVQCCLEEENRRWRGVYCIYYQNYKYAPLIALMEAVRYTTLHGSISRWLPSLNYLQFDTSRVREEARNLLGSGCMILCCLVRAIAHLVGR
jgi:hypothetical protein